MDLSLPAEHLAVREVAADFVDREIVPYARDWDRSESVDTAIVKKLGGLGFLGLTIPEELGGSGGDHLAYCLVMEELGRGDSSVRGIVSVSLGDSAITQPPPRCFKLGSGRRYRSPPVSPIRSISSATRTLLATQTRCMPSAQTRGPTPP